MSGALFWLIRLKTTKYMWFCEFGKILDQ